MDKLCPQLHQWFAALLLTWSVVGCRTDSEQLNTLPVLQDPPDHLSRYPEIALYDSSHLKALIQAGRARVYFKHQYTILDSHVTVTFFNAQERPQSTLSADSILIDDKSHHLMAAGKVFVKADSPATRLFTSRLFWDKRSRLLYTPDSVIVETPSKKIYAVGFESDERLAHYTFRNVQMVLQKQTGE